MLWFSGATRCNLATPRRFCSLQTTKWLRLLKALREIGRFPAVKHIVQTMASLAAALLDELMGRNRNALPTDRTKELSYNDAEVRYIKINIFHGILLKLIWTGLFI